MKVSVRIKDKQKFDLLLNRFGNKSRLINDSIDLMYYVLEKGITGKELEMYKELKGYKQT